MSIRRSGLILGALLAAIVSNCSDDLGPRGGQAFLNIVPEFQFSAGAPLLPVADVHVIVIRQATDEIVINTIIRLNPTTDTVNLALPVSLRADRESFVVQLDVRDANGMVLFSGSIVALASTTDSVTPAPLPVIYVGPGSTAAFILINNQAPTLLVGDSLLLSTVVIDSMDAAVPNAPVRWTSLDPTIVDVPVPSIGRIFARTPGQTSVVAALLNGAADTIPVTVVVQPTVTGVKWVAPTSGNWSNPANWSTGQVPGPNDTAIVDLAGTYIVTVDQPVNVAGLIFGAPSGQQALIVGDDVTVGTFGMQIGANAIIDMDVDVLFHSAGNMIMNGVWDWFVGTIGDGSGMNVLINGTLNINQAGTLAVESFGLADNTAISVLGSAVAQGDSVQMGSGSSFTIDPGGTLDVQSPTTFFETGAGPAIVASFGTLQLDNLLTVSTTQFRNNLSSLTTGSGTLDLSGAAITLFAGAIAPGSPVGTLTIVGNVTLNTQHVIDMTINGTTAGVDHDVLVVNGNLTLAGRLNVAQGFQPILGQTFTIVQFNASTGSFGSITGVNVGNGVLLSETINSTDFQLTAITPPVGTEVRWIASGGGLWSNGANWSSGSPPTPGDSVVFDLGSSYVVTVDVSPTVHFLHFKAGTPTLAGAQTITTTLGSVIDNTPTVSFAGGLTVSGTNQLVINLNGHLAVTRGSISMPVNLSGTLQLSDTVRITQGILTSTGSAVYLDAHPVTPTTHVVLSGGMINNGLLEMRDPSGSNLNIELVINGTLQNGSLITVDGTGGARVLDGTLANSGLLGVNTPLLLTNRGASTNMGVVHIDAGASLTVSGGTFSNADVGGQNLGVLSGLGTLDVTNTTFVDAGNITPGSSPGIFTLAGPYPGMFSSAIVFELGGTVAGSEHDQLVVTGNAAINGFGAVTPFGNYVPRDGDQATLMTFASRTGNFVSWFVPDLGVGFGLDTTWTATALEVTVRAQILMNGDSAGIFTGQHRINPSGDNHRTITPEGLISEIVHPRFSPDRSRITYSAGYAFGQNANQLHVTAADGSVIAHLTGVADSQTVRPRFNADGTHLAYECNGSSPFGPLDVCVTTNVDVPVATLDGRGIDRILTKDVSTTLTGSAAFAWDPLNPNRLAIVRDVPVTALPRLVSKIYVINVDGTGLDSITPPLAFPGDTLRIHSMDWAPDGSYLALGVRRQGNGSTYEMWRVNVDGSNPMQLTDGGGEADEFPVVSPNSSEILFLRNRFVFEATGYNIWRVAATGGAPVQVTNEPQTVFVSSRSIGYDWSPDGSEVVLTGFDDPANPQFTVTYVVPANTTSANYLTIRRRVSLPGWQDLQPSWRH